MGITALVFSKIPALLAMSGKDIALLVVCGLAIIFLIALVAVSFRLNIIRKRAEAEEKHADKVKIVKGVRYSEDDAIAEGEGMNVTHAPGDFILVRGETYHAEKGGKLLPGVYTALSASGSEENFKLRIGGFVKNFAHGDSVVLAEGEEITAVSAPVILR